MKRNIFILFAFALLLAGCDKVTETYDEPATILEVTASYVVFDADGGNKTVLVNTNTDWDFTCGDDWFSVVRGDDALEIHADANTAANVRQSEITLDAKSLSTTIVVTQLPEEEVVENLSENETANCYVVKTGSTYKFNATVKGNGVVSDIGGVGVYEDIYGTTINPEEIVYADLLWEAVFNGDKTSSRLVMSGKPVYADGYVHFTTGEIEGNAVIAVKDALGTVLWSWHIWVCNSEIEETYGNGYYWQDRNLGAVSKEPCNVNNRGLLYQWGRKDPFLPSSAAYGAEKPDVANEQVGDGSGKWNYTSFQSRTEKSAPGNIPLSIENPMNVLLYNGVRSWYLSVSNDDNNTNYLWGDSDTMSNYVKSIFDPCPAGYNVPVENPWISSSDASVNVWTLGEDIYGRYWTGGEDAFYPMTGELLGTTGALSGSSTYGYYWTSGIFPPLVSYTTTYMYFNADNTLAFASSYPVHAMAVRCMRVGD